MAVKSFTFSARATDGVSAESGALTTAVRKNTSTTIVVYTDSALTIAAASPHVADALGLVGPLYWNDSVEAEVTFNVTTADGGTTLLQVDYSGGVFTASYAQVGQLTLFEETATGDGSDTTFVLSDVVASSPYQMDVTIDGLLQHKGSYTVSTDGTDTTVTFTEAPPLSAVIYFTASTLAALSPTIAIDQSSAIVIPSGASIGRTLAAWTGDVFNVKAGWGGEPAVGDGVTDDAAAIDRALTACGVAGGGIVEMPDGVYAVDNCGTALNDASASPIGFVGIPIRYSNIELAGAGIDRTIIKPVAGVARHLLCFGPNLSNIHIHDMTVYGSFETLATATSGLRLLAPCANILVERVKFIHHAGYGAGVAYETDEGRAENIKYVDCEFAYCEEGTDVHRGGHIEYVGCIAHHNVQGGFDGRGADLVYTRCRAYANGGDGFGSGPISANWPENRATLTDCWSYDNGLNGYRPRDAAESFPLIIPLTTGGSADAYTVTAAPTVASLALGAQTYVTFHTANLTTTPTINVSGLGAKKIIMGDRTAPRAGDLGTAHPYALIYRPSEDSGMGAWCVVMPHEAKIVCNGFMAWGNAVSGIGIIAGRGNIQLNGCQLFRNQYGLSVTQQSGTGYHDPHNLTVTVSGGSIRDNLLEQVLSTTYPCNMIFEGVEVIQPNADEAIRCDASGDFVFRGGRIVGGTNAIRLRALTPTATTGTDTAYVLTHTAAVGIRPQLNNNQRISCTFNVTNGATPTINVDSLGAKKLLNFGAAALSGAELQTVIFYYFQYDTAADGGSGAWVRIPPPFYDIDTIMRGQTSSCVNAGQYMEGRIDGTMSGTNGIILLSTSGRVVLPSSLDMTRITGTNLTDPSSVAIKDYGDVLHGSTTFNPASLVDGAGETTTVTVTGAALGDFAEVSFSLTTSGISITAWVSAANTVSVRFQNESGGLLDIGSGTLRARVKQRPN